MLSNDDLYEINGGAIKAGVIALIIGGVTFIIGVIDGYLRPLRCN